MMGFQMSSFVKGLKTPTLSTYPHRTIEDVWDMGSILSVDEYAHAHEE